MPLWCFACSALSMTGAGMRAWQQSVFQTFQLSSRLLNTVSLCFRKDCQEFGLYHNPRLISSLFRKTELMRLLKNPSDINRCSTENYCRGSGRPPPLTRPVEPAGTPPPLTYTLEVSTFLTTSSSSEVLEQK